MTSTWIAENAIKAGGSSEASQPNHHKFRGEYARFQEKMEENFWNRQGEMLHTLRQYFPAEQLESIAGELDQAGATLAAVQPAANANDSRMNYPIHEPYDGIGRRIDEVRHHGGYAKVGDAIYGTDIVRRLTERGGLKEGFAFYFLASMLGEAGHNCPVICNFETARLLEKHPEIPFAQEWIGKLLTPNYRDNLTASQFLTEVTGGSDVGANATIAERDEDGEWRITGEKWFTSNADADLNIITARYDTDRPGTKGLSVFLVPRTLPDGSHNSYTLRRLKDKLGTRALATAEIDYRGAWAIPLSDDAERGFNIVMSNFIHLSRMALSVAVIAMSTRAYDIAKMYAQERSVFGRTVIDHAVNRENLALMRSHTLTMQAGLWQLIDLQDQVDLGVVDDTASTRYIRLMSSAVKAVSGEAAVDHCHHALDTFSGNGTIETFSPIPRLLRDAITQENWEGAHNAIRAQIMRDILRYDVDDAYLVVMRRFAGKMASLEDTSMVADRLDRIEDAVKVIRASEDDDERHMLVTWLIRDMVNVAGWAALLSEARDQEERDGGSVKRHAANLFRMRYLEEGRPTYSQAERIAIDGVIEWTR
ncbi:hypothetical protein DEU38_12947 [Rhodococcus sp. AG1013]|uniref:acyl-CoA dehydrogenase family protein n=1 Tax=Rhodococcus sp. AG1013 TaxID=2183996 RepID=UPI000E0C01B8|nr:acyl-CoA dehydrogenase family protein [Rhodococcus sp. AG1013]RDI16198.1 hypothetical protein DEU38_12947 [Rhodococcus sp. AG1013]